MHSEDYIMLGLVLTVILTIAQFVYPAFTLTNTLANQINAQITQVIQNDHK